MGTYQQTISLGRMIGPAFGSFLSDIIDSRMRPSFWVQYLRV